MDEESAGTEGDRRPEPSKGVMAVDARTHTVYKVSCMSCIRGHRTLSCGSRSCRSKVFWTVRRAGRPQGNCTCSQRNGICRCSRIRSVCTHKPKKGENKRAIGCRCDEQGRYCCLLDDKAWKIHERGEAIPTDFHPNREALLAASNAAIDEPATPSTAGIQTGTPNTPFYNEHAYNEHADGGGVSVSPFDVPDLQPPGQSTPVAGVSTTGIDPFNFDSPHFPSTQPQVPRFGFMGVSAPQGNDNPYQADELAWHGSAPIAPRDCGPSADFMQSDLASQQQQRQLLDDHSIPMTQSFQNMSMMPGLQASESFQNMRTMPGPPVPEPTQTSQLPLLYLPQLQSNPFEPQAGPYGATDMASQPSMAPSLGMDDLDFDLCMDNIATAANHFGNASSMAAYNSYQFPSAICQQCGFAECSCTNCPTLLQSYSNTSWAHGCHKAHTRVPAEATNSAPQAKGCCGSRKKVPQPLQPPSDEQQLPELSEAQLDELINSVVTEASRSSSTPHLY